MNIVLVTHFYPAHGGGIELVAQQIARGLLTRHRCTITWFASDTDPPPNPSEVTAQPMSASNVVERFTGLPYPLWTLRSMYRLAQSVRNADVVHVHDAIYMGSLMAATLARWYGKPILVTQHIGQLPLRGYFLTGLFWVGQRLASWLVLKRARQVVFVSLVVRDYFEALIGRQPQFHVVVNGVDQETFKPADRSAVALRAELGLDPAQPLLLFVGRFVPKKRLPVIRALASASPQWQWCVVGHGPEDPRTWGLSNVSVRPACSQRELALYYQAADLLVLPSVGEGFPLVVQEAMACGTPALIPAETARGVALPAGSYIEIPAPDDDSWSRTLDRIREWLSASKEDRNAMQAACLSEAGKWRWDHCVDQHMGLLGSAKPRLDEGHP